MNKKNMRYTGRRNRKFVSDSVEVTPIKTVRRRAIRAAKELFYDDECIRLLQNVTSELEATKILAQARERSFA